MASNSRTEATKAEAPFNEHTESMEQPFVQDSNSEERRTPNVNDTSINDGHVQTPNPPPGHSWRFWCLFGSMCLVSFICSIDATIVTTSLPTITREIGGAEKYVWIANCFVIASTAPQPLFAQTSNIFGRRNPMLLALGLFTLGSGIAGGSTGPVMLIAGRTIQGLGTGGIYMILDVLICDLVPLRERGKYLGITLSTAAVGTALGPIIGGSLAEASWRWVFYLNLPISGIALVAVVLFLNVNYVRSPSWKSALLRVDVLGNAIFIPSIISILLALTLSSVQYDWNTWHILLPLILGFAGWGVFHIHQASRICAEPSMPPRLFKNRTSAIGFVLMFISSLILQAVAYYVPVYFQAVLGVSPLDAGVYFLPFTLAVVPSGIVSGLVLSKTGAFRPLHWAGYAMNAVGCGLLAYMDNSPSTVTWVFALIITAFGTGAIMTSLLPAILASLPESDVAVATGTFSFIRSFGYIWGVTLPGVVFNTQFNQNLGRIHDVTVRATLANGAAYGYSSGAYIDTLPSATQDTVVGIFTDSLRPAWYMSMGFALFALCLGFLEKHVELRQELETKFGLQDGNGGGKGESLDSEKAHATGSSEFKESSLS